MSQRPPEEDEIEGAESSDDVLASSECEDSEPSQDEDDTLDEDALDEDALEDDNELGASEQSPKQAKGGSNALASTLILAALGAWGVVAFLRWGGEDPDPIAPPPMAMRDDGEAEAPQKTKTPDIERAPEKKSAPAPKEEEPPPEEDPEPELAEVDAEWAKGLSTPNEVRYRIRRGGSMKRVANLYKIYHHEITALNAGVDLDRELPPGTDIFVYRAKTGTKSESVGLPSRGTLKGGVPMKSGPGRILKMTPWKSWATASVVALMDAALQEWNKRYPEAHDVLVGNMSARDGGRLKPHGSHQSGRDVDIGYMQKLAPGAELNWQYMNAQNLDREQTWKLLELFYESGEVEVFFIDRQIQKLLYEYARDTRKMSKNQLSRWLEYPRSTGAAPSARVRHIAGHTDHIHIRFRCPADQKQCRSK